MEKDAKIYIAGHTGLAGSAIVRKLKSQGYTNCLLRMHKQLDLTRQKEVEDFFKIERPQYVILAAAKVGGIYANIAYPAEFIYENLAMQANVIHAAYIFGTQKLLFFGTACSYPRDCPQPMKEERLLSGYLELTNEPYAVAKIAGMKMCQAYNRQYKANFICCILTNTYGPFDRFDSEDSHVIPALIKRFHEAKLLKQPSVRVWGTGNTRREFIFVDDVADASLYLMDAYNEAAIINVGFGQDISIKELVTIIKEIVGYDGEIVFDASKPDGAPCKFLDVSLMRSRGWKAKTSLDEGIRKTYDWYTANYMGRHQ